MVIFTVYGNSTAWAVKVGFRKRLVEDYKKDGNAIGNALSSRCRWGA